MAASIMARPGGVHEAVDGVNRSVLVPVPHHTATPAAGNLPRKQRHGSEAGSAKARRLVDSRDNRDADDVNVVISEIFGNFLDCSIRSGSAAQTLPEMANLFGRTS